MVWGRRLEMWPGEKLPPKWEYINNKANNVTDDTNLVDSMKKSPMDIAYDLVLEWTGGRRRSKRRYWRNISKETLQEGTVMRKDIPELLKKINAFLQRTEH